MGKAYLGSKATAGLCQPIIGMMPPHTVFIETHLGSGAIMKRKPPALHNIGIDLEARAIADFTCDYPVELIHGCCHEFLRTYEFDGTELAFCDPPYVRSSRKAPERYRYRYDYEDQGHVELLGILNWTSLAILPFAPLQVFEVKRIVLVQKGFSDVFLFP